MGRSSVAVFWGDVPNPWSNPSLLACRKGLGYEWGRTRLVPDLANNVYYTSKHVTLAYWGVGLLFAGKPFDGVGSSRLDYGESFATDVDGNILGTFSAFEETESFGVGGNIVELAEHVSDAVGRPLPRLRRFGDVGIGWRTKKTRVAIAPGSLIFPGIDATVVTKDSGILARLTPYDAIGYEGLLPALDRFVALRLDLSYGGATQNYNDPIIDYGDSEFDPVARVQIKGRAARLALDPPRRIRPTLDSHGLSWLLDVVSPAISLGAAKSRDIPMILDRATHTHTTGTPIDNSGWELTIANIYSIRGGKIFDPSGMILGHTSGWGIGLHWKDVAGFSYDRAIVPQAIDLGRVHRKSFAFYFSPIRAWELWRGGKRGTSA
jgi:hypothetical protein